MKENPRSRVVTFRLSEAEYDTLKSACGEDQNSVSSIARKTVLEWAESVTDRPKVHDRLAAVTDRLDTLIDLFHKERERDVDLP